MRLRRLRVGVLPENEDYMAYIDFRALWWEEQT